MYMYVCMYYFIECARETREKRAKTRPRTRKTPAYRKRGVAGRRRFLVFKLLPKKEAVMKKSKTGKKAPKTDGLGPREIAQVRSAIRQVWQRCYARKLVIDRCTGSDGFQYCEAKTCESKGKAVPKVYVDHIINVGDLDEGFIKRLFVSSSEMQGLCKKCHDAKTKLERKKNGARKKRIVSKRRGKDLSDDFF